MVSDTFSGETTGGPAFGETCGYSHGRSHNVHDRPSGAQYLSGVRELAPAWSAPASRGGPPRSTVIDAAASHRTPKGDRTIPPLVPKLHLGMQLPPKLGFGHGPTAMRMSRGNAPRPGPCRPSCSIPAFLTHTRRGWNRPQRSSPPLTSPTAAGMPQSPGCPRAGLPCHTPWHGHLAHEACRTSRTRRFISWTPRVYLGIAS